MEAFDIVILAMIAGFIILRLRAELGKKTGDEPMPGGMSRRGGDFSGGPRDADHNRRHGDQQVDTAGDLSKDAYGRPVEDDSQRGTVVDLSGNPAIRQGLSAVRRADSSFDPAAFLDGAAAAYRMILEAFWTGDRDTLKSFLSEDVYSQFVAAVDARESAGQTTDNRVLDIENADITAAEMDGRTAEITVDFTTDLIAVTRDADGTVVDGNMSDSVTVHDVWTFARDTRSKSPNWTLIATRSA